MSTLLWSEVLLHKEGETGIESGFQPPVKAQPHLAHNHYPHFLMGTASSPCTAYQ